MKDDPCVDLSREYAGKYSAQFLRAIDKALAVEAARRPQSVAEWRALLGTGVEEKIIAEPRWLAWLEQLEAARAWAAKNPLPSAGAVAAALLLGVLLWPLLAAAVTPAPSTPPPQPGTPGARDAFAGAARAADRAGHTDPGVRRRRRSVQGLGCFYSFRSFLHTGPPGGCHPRIFSGRRRRETASRHSGTSIERKAKDLGNSLRRRFGF